MASNNSLIGNLDVAGTLTQSSVQVLTSGATSALGTTTITSASVNALAAGLAGATNPALNVDASTALSVTGFNIKSGISGGGLAASVISSAAAENLTIDAKGTGTLTLNGTATGAITLGRATTLGAGVMTLPNGAVGAPALNLGDATTGLYRSALNVLAVTNAGTLSMTFSAGGVITGNTNVILTPASGSYAGIGIAGTAAAPSFVLTDTTTGWFRSALNTWAFSTNGVNSFNMAGGASGGVTLTALGTNQNITLTPSGTGNIASGIAGTAANPAIVLTDATTGFYRPAANQLGITTNGVLAATFNATQQTTFAASVIFPGTNTQTGATYTVLVTDVYLIANAAGTQTLTLGTATAGRRLVVRTIAAQTVVSASSNVVPSAGGAAGTAILAATAGKWAELVGDGTNWQVMAAN